MDEKARIFRTCVWFSPIQPPRAVEAIAIMERRVGFSEGDVMKRIVIGGNFITVDKSIAVVSEDPWSTSGNQKWNGTNPSFIAIAVVNSVHAMGWFNWVMSHCPEDQALIVLENRSSVEAAAWVRKYLIAASIARGWWCFAMRGIMARVLISSPVQAIIQWLLEIVMVVPKSRLMVKISLA